LVQTEKLHSLSKKLLHSALRKELPLAILLLAPPHDWKLIH
jgi:hypothetical protein